MPDDKITISINYFDMIKDPANGTIVKVEGGGVSSFEPLFGLTNYTNDENIIVYDYDISKDLKNRNLSSVLHRMLDLKVSFALHSLRVDKNSRKTRCLHIFGNVSFNDKNHNGQVIIQLSTQTVPITCTFPSMDAKLCEQYHEIDTMRVKVLAFLTVSGDTLMFFIGTGILIALCCCSSSDSCCNCCVNIYRPSPGECFFNVQWWHIISIAGDSFTLHGVHWITDMLQGHLNLEDGSLSGWDKHLVYIGSGCLLTWFSFLRFIRIHDKLSLLFKTIRTAALDVIFFLACVCIIFIGFWLCTYIVLGPYNVKFQRMSTTAETLFSIINGDEIYATFSILQESKAGDITRIRWFSRLIIYAFVTLFTVLVVNLLIALFNSAYEVVRSID
ncbi:mucolipin-1-like [Mercenaria mercenaria]|uniref:mucolipin-1-like n=1 Tax=Mercenaria mercenaria TaxID=6596 RepID=UPI00234EE1F0|nr:mucolipin-1-like [Mercenaria mercenaria]